MALTALPVATSPVHPSDVQTLVYATLEVCPSSLTVLTISTEQVTDNGAPVVAGRSWLLHWEKETTPADAGVEEDSRTTALSPAAKTTAANTAEKIRNLRRVRGRSLMTLDMFGIPPPRSVGILGRIPPRRPAGDAAAR
jgi:hypothetical protein